MAGNFQCPQGQICSKEYGTAVGSRNTNLYFRTSTAISQGDGTNITGGTTTLYTWVPDTTSGFTFGTGQGSWQPAARSSDGKKWELLKDSNGKQVLGADAEKSLVSTNGNLNKNVAANTTKTLNDAGVKPIDAQKVIQSNTETIQDAANGDGSVPPELNEQTDKKLAEIAGAITSAGTRSPTDYKNDKYPLDLDANQDTINFTMVEHRPQRVTTANFASGNPFGGRGDIKQRGGTITLPIQPSITDSNGVSWSGQSINPLESFLAASAAATITSGGAGVSSSLEGVSQLLQSKAGSEGLKSAIAYGLVSENKNFFTKATGAISNPNLELLFDAPTLRQFTFSFILSAREKKESEAIRRIIRFFKQGMSVKRADTGLFLKSPHTFEIKYKKGSTDHPYLNKIKECALLNFTVDYTPGGNYATYEEDGAMTMYALSMTFQELDPIYDDDYKQFGNEAIGY